MTGSHPVFLAMGPRRNALPRNVFYFFTAWHATLARNIYLVIIPVIRKRVGIEYQSADHVIDFPDLS